jgi:DeoR/GlpR family transcriptional regulator of sugar metabolism
MLTAERRQYILESLRREGKVLTQALSATLGVSEDVVRRDLRELDAAGLLLRVHGGALPRSPAETTYSTRQRQAPQAKAAIAAAAAGLLRDGQVILMDAGTTALAVAQSLAADLHATVITASPPIVVALAAHPHVEAIGLGGRLRKESMVLLGAETVAAVGRVRADVYVLGIGSIHPEMGMSTADYEHAQLKRAMIAAAADVIALASAERLGTAAAHIVGSLGDLAYLVTERAVPDETLAPYRAAGIGIVQS